MTDSVRPHGLQHTRPPGPLPSSQACSNSCPSSQWCHPTISSSSPPAFNLSQHQGLSNESALCIRCPNYWSLSFSICPSNEYSGLISFRIDWLDLLAVQGTLKGLYTLQRTLKWILRKRMGKFYQEESKRFTKYYCPVFWCKGLAVHLGLVSEIPASYSSLWYFIKEANALMIYSWPRECTSAN